MRPNDLTSFKRAVPTGQGRLSPAVGRGVLGGAGLGVAPLDHLDDPRVVQVPDLRHARLGRGSSPARLAHLAWARRGRGRRASLPRTVPGRCGRVTLGRNRSHSLTAHPGRSTAHTAPSRGAVDASDRSPMRAVCHQTKSRVEGDDVTAHEAPVDALGRLQWSWGSAYGSRGVGHMGGASARQRQASKRGQPRSAP